MDLHEEQRFVAAEQILCAGEHELFGPFDINFNYSGRKFPVGQQGVGADSGDAHPLETLVS